MWDLSCVDWAERIRSGRSLIPDLPLIEGEAAFGLEIFDQLKLPDVDGLPTLRDACGQWFRDIVRVVFGSWDPVAGERMIRDIFLLAPKGQSKTSYSAALILVAMLMNKTPRAEMLFVGPTQAISDRAYGQVEGMIDASPELTARFHTMSYHKKIKDLLNGSEMSVRTFDVKILTGSMLSFVLLDELHLLGRNVHTSKVLRQIRGGLEKRRDGMLLITTTQSDERPVGAFRSELMQARKIRDGAYRGQNMRPLLPILYEFPEDIAKDADRWKDPAVWPMVMPNLGRSVQLNSLIQDWESERLKGGDAIAIWASQHLNIEIGIGLKSDRWAGADYWERRGDPKLDLATILGRSEIIVVGIDGGGLDDLFGLTILGREPIEIEVSEIVDGAPARRKVKRWLCWSHAWCHKGVLERRQLIAAVLLDFEAAGELTIVDDELDDISAIVDHVSQILDRGLLGAVAVDPAGLGEFVDAMAEIGVTQENKLLVGVGQGFRMMNAIKTAERRLANGTLLHGGSSLMAWCVANLKIEPLATAIRATKQNAGDAKIDPVMALFDAIDIMSTNPEASSVYETRGLLVL